MLKKFGYTSECFRLLYEGKREKAYFHPLAQLQKSLGHSNDIIEAEHLLEPLSISREMERIPNRLSSQYAWLPDSMHTVQPFLNTKLEQSSEDSKTPIHSGQKKLLGGRDQINKNKSSMLI